MSEPFDDESAGQAHWSRRAARNPARRRRGGMRAGATAGDGALDAAFAEYARRYGPIAAAPEPDAPPSGDRWSTWDASSPTERGPRPYPDWVITEAAAVDTEVGVLKTGKEADVHLLERGVPGTGRTVLLAAKRYRDATHRMFHRDAGYLEGRADRESRVNRAMARRTEFGKQAIAGRWAGAEFGALCRLFQAGVAVPYPVQIVGTEILMEFVGTPDGTAAPRLAELRPDPGERDDLWWQLTENLTVMAAEGYAHGDLSAYNLLVHQRRLIIIDVPQIVDIIANANGPAYLARDIRNVGAWFTARGLPQHRVDHLLQALA